MLAMVRIVQRLRRPVTGSLINRLLVLVRILMMLRLVRMWTRRRV